MSGSASNSTVYFYGKAIPGREEVTSNRVTTHLDPTDVDKIVDGISSLRSDSGSHVVVTYNHGLDKCGRVIAGYRTKDNGLGCIGSVDNPEAAAMIRRDMEKNKSNNRNLMGISPFNAIEMLIDPDAPKDPVRSGKGSLQMWHMSLVPEPDFAENGTWVEHADTDPAAFFEKFSEHVQSNASYFNKADNDALNLLKRRLQLSRMSPVQPGHKRFYKAHSATDSEKEIAIDSGSQLGQVLKDVAPVLPIEYAPVEVRERYMFPKHGLEPVKENSDSVPAKETVTAETATGTNKTEVIASNAEEVKDTQTQPSDQTKEDVTMAEPVQQPQQTLPTTPAAPLAPAATTANVNSNAPVGLFEFKNPAVVDANAGKQTLPGAPAPTTPAPAVQHEPLPETPATGNRPKRSAGEMSPEIDANGAAAEPEQSPAKKVATQEKVNDPAGTQPHILKLGDPIPAGAKIVADPGEFEQYLKIANEAAVNAYKEKIRLENMQAMRQKLIEDYHAAGASDSELNDAIDLLRHPNTGDAGYKAVERLVISLKSSKAGQPGLSGVPSGRQAEASLQNTLNDMEASAKAKAAAAGATPSASSGQEPHPETAKYFKLSTMYASGRYGMPPVPAPLQFQLPSAPAQPYAHQQSNSVQPAVVDHYALKAESKLAAINQFRAKSIDAFHSFIKLSLSTPDAVDRSFEAQKAAAGTILSRYGDKLPYGVSQQGGMSVMEITQ